MSTTTTKPQRERPKAVKLTDAAAARIREIVAGADGRYQGVRVGVANGGCAGMSYTMDYAESAKPLEEVVGVGPGFRVQGERIREPCACQDCKVDTNLVLDSESVGSA